MRIALALAVAAACGDNRIAPHDAPPIVRQVDAPASPPIDALACARRGTALAVVAIADVRDTVTALVPHDGVDYVATRTGRVFLLGTTGLVQPTPILDIGDRVSSLGTEEGLVGLAFDGPTMYLAYTTAAHLVVEREPDREAVLSIALPSAIHHGGALAIGPDHRMYLGVGDGGSEPTVARSPASLLGKVLALDLASPAPPTIVARGLRNPWRFAFDPATGAIWLGDVGERSVEEIDRIDPPPVPAPDFGWPMYEGDTCHTPPCDPAGITAPLATHTHAADGWLAVIGGEVYRGACFPDLAGSYLYADFGSRTLARRAPDGTVALARGLLPTPPTAFGTDTDGEVLVGGYNGVIVRVVVDDE